MKHKIKNLGKHIYSGISSAYVPKDIPKRRRDFPADGCYYPCSMGQNELWCICNPTYMSNKWEPGYKWLNPISFAAEEEENPQISNAQISDVALMAEKYLQAGANSRKKPTEIQKCRIGHNSSESPLKAKLHFADLSDCHLKQNWAILQNLPWVSNI